MSQLKGGVRIQVQVMVLFMVLQMINTKVGNNNGNETLKQKHVNIEKMKPNWPGRVATRTETRRGIARLPWQESMQDIIQPFEQRT